MVRVAAVSFLVLFACSETRESELARALQSHCRTFALDLEHAHAGLNNEKPRVTSLGPLTLSDRSGALPLYSRFSLCASVRRIDQREIDRLHAEFIGANETFRETADAAKAQQALKSMQDLAGRVSAMPLKN